MNYYSLLVRCNIFSIEVAEYKYEYGESGTITHKNYTNDEHIIWVISTDCTQVQLISNSFDLEDPYDVLTLQYDGERTEFTGNGFGDDFIVPTNYFELVFTSDGSVTQS